MDRIDSQSDSQTGGDYFPPSEGSSSESPAAQRQQQEQQQRQQQQQQQQSRPANLSLNISALPPALSFSANMSPASLVSTSAPFTDATSLSLVGDPSDDYFRFAEASIASAANGGDQASGSGISFAPQMNGQQQQQQPQSATQPRINTNANMNQTPPAPLTAPSTTGTFPGSYRVPASQPTSPVRMMPSAQQFRQRSATTSIAGDNGASQFSNGVSPNGVSAVPTHLSFTAIHGGSGSGTASPVVSTTPGGDHAASQVAVALGDVSMDDASQTTPSRPSHSRHPSANLLSGAPNPNLAQQMNSAVPTGNDIAERLTMERLTMLDT